MVAIIWNSCNLLVIIIEKLRTGVLFSFSKNLKIRTAMKLKFELKDIQPLFLLDVFKITAVTLLTCSIATASLQELQKKLDQQVSGVHEELWFVTQNGQELSNREGLWLLVFLLNQKACELYKYLLLRISDRMGMGTQHDHLAHSPLVSPQLLLLWGEWVIAFEIFHVKAVWCKPEAKILCTRACYKLLCLVASNIFYCYFCVGLSIVNIMR